MKKLFALLFIAVLCESADAQDLIIKHNGDTIRAKITEISDDVVRYKKQNNLNGPTFVTSKSEINKLVYANGTQEVMAAPVPVPAPKSTEPNIDYKNDGQAKQEQKAAEPEFSPIVIESYGYYYKGRRMNDSRFAALYKSYNDQTLITEFAKAKNLHTTSIITGAIGIPCAVSGVVLTIISAIPVEEYDDYTGDYYMTHPYSSLLWPGIGLFTGFVVMETIAIVTKANYKNKLRKTAEHYNSVIAKHELR